MTIDRLQLCERLLAVNISNGHITSYYICPKYDRMAGLIAWFTCNLSHAFIIFCVFTDSIIWMFRRLNTMCIWILIYMVFVLFFDGVWELSHRFEIFFVNIELTRQMHGGCYFRETHFRISNYKLRAINYPQLGPIFCKFEEKSEYFALFVYQLCILIELTNFDKVVRYWDTGKNASRSWIAENTEISSLWLLATNIFHHCRFLSRCACLCFLLSFSLAQFNVFVHI